MSDDSQTIVDVEVTCAACTKTFEPDEAYFDAAGAWREGDDDVEYACPTCKKAQRLVEWEGPWSMGFGNLGFTHVLELARAVTGVREGHSEGARARRTGREAAPVSVGAREGLAARIVFPIKHPAI